MKKSLNSALLRFLMMGGVLVSIVFTACENFLDGAVLKKSVEKEIEWEKAESLSVLVTPEEGTGSTVPFGNYDCKLGYFFEVSFTENNSYSFIKWAAVSADNLSEEIEGVLFEDASSPKTTVKFARPISNVRILPVCTQRIAVSGEPSPRYEPNGVARDRSISVTFTKELSEDNFIFQPEELPQGAAAQTDDDGKIWAYVSGNQTFLKNISITNADDFSIAEHFSRPQVTGRLLTIPVDKTKPIQFNSGEVFKTIKVTLSKDISDSDNIKMNYSKSWNYLITEATDEKATVNLSGNSSEGSVYLAGTKDYSLGQKITLAFTENTDWQFIKWDYDSSVIYIDNPQSINTTAVVIEKTTEDNPTQIRAVCARRLRLAENGYEPKTAGNETVSKNSSIQLTFEQNLPADAEDRAQLANLSITVGGTPVRTCFNAPEISGNTVSFTANKSNMLDVTEGQTKTVTVTIPADFYYKLDDGTKVTWGGNGFAFDYRIDSTTTQKASVVFEMENDSGTITPAAGLHEYSEGQEVAVSFVPADGWEFRGWTVKTGAGDDVPASKIKILDPDTLSTKLIVYDALSDVKIRADAVLLPAVSSFTPAYESGGKDCDTPVVIIFNKAMKTDTFNLYSEADAQGMKGTIQIVNPSNEYEHYEEYFNAPSWSADGKTLTIKPKNTIRDALVKNDSDLRNIRIVFDISKVSDTDGNKLKEADASWVYRINHSMETIAPTVTMKMYKRGFDIQEDSTGEYTTVENDTYTELSALQFTSFTDNDYSKNHVGKKIYFDATATDTGSGYKQLTIQETLIRTVDATVTSQACKASEPYTAAMFTKQVYELQSLFDGVVQLDFVFEDYAGSKATRTWYVIKDTILNDSEAAKPNLPLRNGNAVTMPAEKNSTARYGLYFSIYDNFISNRTSDNDIITEKFDFRNNNFSGETFYQDQKSLCKYRFSWGYSQNSITNSVSGSEDRLFSFDRQADKYCFVKLSIFDEVGNVKTLNINLPAQSCIVSRKKQEMYVHAGESIFTDYYYSFDYVNKSDGYIVLYTFQENTNSTVSEYRIRENADSYGFRLTFYSFFDTTFCPAGIYKLYILPFTKITSNVYYYAAMPKEPYTLYISYDSDGKQVVTDVENETKEPSFPGTISFTVEDASKQKNAGTHTVHVSDNFTKSDGFTYGVCYGDSNYADFDFTVPSGKSYTVKLFAKNNNTSQVFKSDDYGTINATYDNIAPYFDVHWVNDYKYVSAPNNAWLFSAYKIGSSSEYKFFPTDGGNPEIDSGIVKNTLGLNEFDYYMIRKSSIKAAIKYDKSSLIGLIPQKASYEDSATQICLNYDNFVEGDYDIVFHLKDNYGNEGITSYSVSNITAPGSPKVYMNDSKLYVEKIKKIEIERNNFSDWWEMTHINKLSDNNWQKLMGRTQRDKKDPLEFSYSAGENTSFLQIYTIYEKMIGIINAPHFNSCYTFICPDYELKSASEKAACCRSKSVIPGLGGAYQVYYDAPCFAHTMAFPTDMLGDLDAKLAEAKSIDSTVDEETYIKAIWETKGREYGLKLINSAWLDNTSTSTYTAPVSEIPAGYSYVTIFHFADGTSVMSEVKQK